MYPKSISNLIEAFKYFPGVGEKTAERKGTPPDPAHADLCPSVYDS